MKRGNPGNAGGGRPPDEFKASMRGLANRPETDEYLKQCLDGTHGPNVFMTALVFATDRGYGKVPTVTRIAGEDQPLEIVFKHG